MSHAAAVHAVHGLGGLPSRGVPWGDWTPHPTHLPPTPHTHTHTLTALLTAPLAPCLPRAPAAAAGAASKTPPSTYNIQLLEVVGGSDPKTYAAMGKSEGFYQVGGRRG